MAPPNYNVHAPRPAATQHAYHDYIDMVSAGILLTTLTLHQPTIPNQPYTDQISLHIRSENARPAGAISAPVRKQSRISALVKRLHKQLTPEQRALLPRDLSNNVDDIVYGS